eukprot:SAG11_NODE_1116_length_5800_cov_21.451149_6_plen_107_part_00
MIDVAAVHESMHEEHWTLDGGQGASRALWAEQPDGAWRIIDEEIDFQVAAAAGADDDALETEQLPAESAAAAAAAGAGAVATDGAAPEPEPEPEPIGAWLAGSEGR